MVFLFHSWYVMLGFSVQRIYSGFKVIEAGIFFAETSDYFLEIIWSSYRPCSQIWNFCVTYVEGFVYQLWECGSGKSHLPFRAFRGWMEAMKCCGTLRCQSEYHIQTACFSPRNGALSLKYAYSIILTVWEGARPWLTPILYGGSTRYWTCYASEYKIVIDIEGKVPQHKLATFSPNPIVLPVICDRVTLQWTTTQCYVV